MTRRSLTIAIALLACADSRPISSEDAPTWSVREDQRIGSVDDESIGFSDIRDLIVARDRTVFVADQRTSFIRSIDSTGRLLHTFGGRGQGPGEFERVVRLGLLGDTLWARDEIRDQFVFFDRSGRVLETATLVAPALPGTDHESNQRAPAALLGGGVALGIYRRTAASTDEPGRMFVRLSRRPDPGAPVPAAVTADGRARSVAPAAVTAPAIDTVARLSLRNHESRFPHLFPYNSRPVSLVFFQPLADSPLDAVSDDGSTIVIVSRPAAARADSASFTVTKVTASWDTVYSRSYTYRPIPATSDLVDSILSNTEEGRLGMPREIVYAPALRPPVTQVLAGVDGTVWLKREFSYGQRARWTLLDEKGSIAGSVELPRDLTVHAADADYFWATIRDADDVPFVVRYRVARDGNGR